LTGTTKAILYGDKKVTGILFIFPNDIVEKPSGP